jgi:uridine kinase
VNAPQEVCLARRIERDMRERGRTEEAVRAQWEATTLPMAELYVLPSAARASMTVEGTGPVEWLVEQVLKRLGEDGFSADLRG